MKERRRKSYNTILTLLILALSIGEINSAWRAVFYGNPAVAGNAENANPYNGGTNFARGDKRYRVVFPPKTNGWYPFYSAHYTGDYYIASSPDVLSWGAEQLRNINERASTDIRRVWIESILDTECFASGAITAKFNAGNTAETTSTSFPRGVPTNAAKAARNGYLFNIRNTCVNCGIGGCERVDISGKKGGGLATQATATNGSVFRSPEYRDWQGYRINADDNSVNGNNPNTYRSEAVTTVAVIDRTNYFLTAGSLERGVVRFNVENNGTYHDFKYNDLGTAKNVVGGAPFGWAGYNRTNYAVDLFVIRPTPFAVVTRIGLNHLMFDYTKMNNLQSFGISGGAAAGTDHGPFPNAANADAGSLLGGYGDYIDWMPWYMYACITPSYSTRIYCYTLNVVNNAANAELGFGIHDLGSPARALVGIDESPYFAICANTQIKVYSIVRNDLAAGGGNNRIDDGDRRLVGVTGAIGTAWTAVAQYNENFDNAIGPAPTVSDDTVGYGVSAALDQQIWDMVYINTHPYAAGNPGTYGRDRRAHV